MTACRPIVPIALMVLSACVRSPSIPPIVPVPDVVEPPATAAAPTPVAAAPEAPCAADDECGYDPARDRCAADPRANRQPPLTDQGIVCYCERARCATFRVRPVPCESDASCAVRLDPRPHPVAADAAHPRPRGRPCRDYVRSAICERTNICTMHEHRCQRPKR